MKSIDLLFDGSYEIEKRMMLEVGIHSGKEFTKFHALNDVVVSRGGLSRLVRLNVLVDDVSVGNYVADGIIVSTPTGSTAYALSAGGPIIDPAVSVMQIIPICSHSLSSRAVIVPAQKNIKILPENDDFESVINIDGLDGVELCDKYEVNISKSPYEVNLIKASGRGFYDILRKKIIEKVQF